MTCAPCWHGTGFARSILGDMTAPADLSKLRINRDAPPPAVRGALVRNLLLLIMAAALLGAGWWYMRERSIPVVQVVTVGPPTGSGSPGTGGATAVTANGYVVARTKASVSAKAAGRLAYLGVSEGSYVKQGVVIARLDNADFQAAIAQAEANVAANEASVIEATSDRDQLVREANRQRDMRAQSTSFVSQQEFDLAVSRVAQAEARVNAAMARKRVAESGLKLSIANNENTIIRAPFTGTVLRKDAEVAKSWRRALVVD